MKTHLAFALLLSFACASSGTYGAAEQVPSVKLIRVPDGGIQPQVAVDRVRGIVDMIYFQGDPALPKIFCVLSKTWGPTFSSPILVNIQPGSAVSVGTIRGAHLAVGKN